MSYNLVTILAAAALAIPTVVAGQAKPLDGFVREALERNLGQRQHELSAERGAAGVKQARGLFLPTVTLDARYSELQGGLDLGELVNPAYRALNQLTGSSQFPTNIDGRYPYAQETRARVVQPLFNAAILSNYRLSVAQRGLQDARTRMAARQLAADVQLAYVGHAKAQQLVTVIDATLALVREQVRVTERLLANGKVTPDAVFRATADRSAVEQQLSDAEQKRSAAARYFNFLLDRPADALVPEIADSLLVAPFTLDLPAVLSAAQTSREELAQGDWGIRAADAQEQLARASYLPSISLAVDYGIQGNQYRFDARSDFTMASVVVQWNLFNGLQDAARKQQASLDAERARVQRTELAHQVELQVRQAFDALMVAQQAQATAAAQLNASRRSFELMSRRYQEGMATLVELLDARTSYTAAQVNRVVTRFDYAARYIELERIGALRNLDEDLTRERER